ncbi:hypothetical protein [Kitasatospora mediocidica]|uniref:hypothetical protein n=1 Tax=Kitasatospora mediocidica TaxID=58352 RepID=UPI00056728CA|nr:hypothetical protein [Kitasatospora mediocidica]
MQPDELRYRYRKLLSTDPVAEQDARYLIDPEEPPARLELRDELDRLFAQRPELGRVVLASGSTDLGVVYPSVLPGADPGSRSAPAGDSGMMGLPGQAHYSLLYFRCPVCPDPVTQAAVFLLDGLPPVCRKEKTHGRTLRIDQ